MRRQTAPLIVMAMLGGCVNYKASKATAIVGGVSAAGGVAIFAVGTKLNAPGVMGGGLGLTLTGLLVVAGARIAMSLHESPSERAAREDAQRQAEVESRRLSWKQPALDLTKAAAEAAREGDCAPAIEAGQLIRGIDREFYTTVFVRIAAIKRCLDAHTEPVPSKIEPAPAVAPSPSP